LKYIYAASFQKEAVIGQSKYTLYKQDAKQTTKIKIKLKNSLLIHKVYQLTFISKISVSGGAGLGCGSGT